MQSRLTSIAPKLPMRSKSATYDYYVNKLHFESHGDYPDYLMVSKEDIEIHFFLFTELDPLENYAQVYIRLDGIESYYQSLLDNKISIHPNAPLQSKPWGQKEFSLLDPDHNLLTFGEGM
jgi:hypothetical protein